jgi:hypothetical protein
MEKKLDMVAHTCHPSNGRKHKIRGSLSMPTWTKNKILAPE